MKEKPGKAKTDATYFRSTEEWKSALMTLPDSNFFELVRSIFGNIKTPFSKQRLLQDLSNLLSRDETQKVIAAYIGEQDHKLITAVALLGEPVPGVLESFFSGEFSYAELQAMIVNLEERLIIYRFREKEVMLLALNPVLEEVLAPFIKDTRPILPSFPVQNCFTSDGGASSYAKMSDARYMAGVFSFFKNEDDLFKTEVETEIRIAGIRKKAVDEWKKIFHKLDLKLAIKTLIQLGLFRRENRRLSPCAEKIAEFSALSSLERREYMAAGMYLCLDAEYDQEDGGYVLSAASRVHLSGIASSIHNFMAAIEADRSYPETTLRRVEMLLEKERASSGRAWGYPMFSFPLQLDFDLLLAVMEQAGLLEKEKNNWKAVNGAAEEQASSGKAKPVLAMDSAFSIILYPEISFADVMALGSFCSVKEIDSTVRFELKRESAVRGFDRGIKADAMTELLNRLSGGRIDASLGWTLKEWEARYDGVALHHGMVLSLTKDRLYLAEAEPVSSLIQKTFAPGVYLLSSDDKTEITKALQKAGVDIIAQAEAGPHSQGSRRYNREVSQGLSRDSFPRLGAEGGKLHNRGALAPPPNKASQKNHNEAEPFLEKFRKLLDTMKLNKQEREELSARIERRLVLSEAQMEATSLRYEKTEARLLDYRGKASIAKHAVDSGSLVEVTWADSGGAQKQFTGIAHALEKKDEDSVLVLTGAENTSGIYDAKTIRLPLGKIILLRRIKQSIFGG